MNETIKLFYLYIVSSILIISILEVGLEYRHYTLGYKTLIFGVIQSPTETNLLINEGIYHPLNVGEQLHEFGPTKEFPFKSKILKKNKNVDLRFWIASASHAEGGRIPAKDIFPNLLCQELAPISQCDVINGSKAGMTIEENIKLMNKYIPEYRSTYTILYQLSMVILKQQDKLNESGSVLAFDITEKLLDLSNLKKVIQSMALYVHLTDYIGGNIKLSGPLKDRLPKKMEAEFERKIYKFLNASFRLNQTPILMTFAASHNTENIDDMHFSSKTNFVKFNSYLSPVGWVNMVASYNNIIRQIAANEKIILIDLADELNGRSEYFVDFVHFNKAGHQKVAEVMGKKIVHELLNIRADS